MLDKEFEHGLCDDELPRDRSGARSAVLALSFLCCAARGLAAEPDNLALNKPACSFRRLRTMNIARPRPTTAMRRTVGGPMTSPRAGRSGGRSIWRNLSTFPVARSAGLSREKGIGTKSRARPTASNWSLLSDQTSTTAKSQVHRLKFRKATQVRYVKITVTGLEEGCWVSILKSKYSASNKQAGAPDESAFHSPF